MDETYIVDKIPIEFSFVEFGFPFLNFDWALAAYLAIDEIKAADLPHENYEFAPHYFATTDLFLTPDYIETLLNPPDLIGYNV